MLKFFQNPPAGKPGIRQKVIKENKICCPFRDLIWVEQTNNQATAVPLGTGYVGKSFSIPNHITSLRHANSDYISVFYRYFVPMGHSESEGSIKASNPLFLH
ncbi:hypothetical protein U3A59_13165 [Algoriphagus sp. E1-3-M2]|nr:hypothetical protein [Algoriphagus sp. E1-3-M2]